MKICPPPVSSRSLLFTLLAVWGGLCQPAPTSAEIGPLPHWIWIDRLPAGGQDVEFSRDFDVGAGLQLAELQLLADDKCQVWLNDKQIAEVASLTAPELHWTTLNVLEQLKPGPNRLLLRAHNSNGEAGVCFRLRLADAQGRTRLIVSDPTCLARETSPSANFPDWVRAVSRGLVGVSPWEDPVGETLDYYQWQQALGTDNTTAPTALQVTPGFQVELVRSAQERESSWISLTFDPQGRALIGREGRDKHHGLIRLTLPTASQPIQVEEIEQTLLEPRGLAFDGSSLLVNANNAKTLYRLDDATGDGQFSAPVPLKQTPGSVGHGRNNLTVGPDGMVYLIHGNDVRLPDDYNARESRCVHVENDQLIPCRWNRLLFDGQAQLPGGHLIRTDRDGSFWELFACGFRNPYGIDFNPDGEAFTFDADNEGDLGTPWYRPTRINHIVPGGDYGWRQGTAMRPSYYPDSLPASLELGKSSPTDIKFGTRSDFPARYQQALFLLDWSYGRIYALQLLPQGSSYVMTAELFLEGRPLNVTDLEFGPDGHLYFTTGGRGTQSGLYRVRYIGPDDVIAEATTVSADEQVTASAMRTLRQRLEEFQLSRDTSALTAAWPWLSSPDEWLRHAARLAIEHQPVDTWQELALAETRPLARETILMALARSSTDVETQRNILGRLNDLPWDELSREQQCLVARTYQLALMRLKQHEHSLTKPILERLTRIYPTRCLPVDQFLCEVLVFLDSPAVVENTLPLLHDAQLPVEKLRWLLALRNVKQGWTLAGRRQFLQALQQTPFDGGRELPLALFAIANEFRLTLNAEEVTALAAELAPAAASPAKLIPQRPLVKEWQLTDLAERLPDVSQGRNLARGAEVYKTANCVACHRLAGEGRPVGPDLKGVTRRFSRRDLLETILVPSKVIDAKYVDQVLELASGHVVTGRIVGGDDDTLLVATNPVAIFDAQQIAKKEIESQTTSQVSPMPHGLLNSFTADEILDLLAFLEAEGRVK